MGRGRKGIINQSMKKLVPRRDHNIAKFLDLPDKSRMKQKSIYGKTLLSL